MEVGRKKGRRKIVCIGTTLRLEPLPINNSTSSSLSSSLYIEGHLSMLQRVPPPGHGNRGPAHRLLRHYRLKMNRITSVEKSLLQAELR